MYTDELIETIRDALAADAALSAWSTAAFGKAPEIWTNVDDNRPPGDDNYPLAVIVDAAQIHGNAANRRSWGVVVGAGVQNAAVTTVGRTVTYEGFLQAERFRELVEAAVVAAKIGKVVFSGETAADSAYPLFISYTVFTIELINSRRT